MIGIHATVFNQGIPHSMSNNAATSHTIPITLIGGYLGAGKTTLINKLLSYPGLPPGSPYWSTTSVTSTSMNL